MDWSLRAHLYDALLQGKGLKPGQKPVQFIWGCLLWTWEKQKKIGDIDILSGGGRGPSTQEEALAFMARFPVGEDLAERLSD